MTVEALSHIPAQVQTPHRFLVMWQDPQSRAYHRVGTLTRDAAGYHFAYASGATVLEGFAGFAAFPDFRGDYRSAELFPMFANRVMTPRRDSYDSYIQALGLPGPHPEPFEVLARTLGTRATDVVQLLPVPRVHEHGIVSFYFLVHGSRHLDPDGHRLAQLRPGDALYLAREPDNPVSPVAVLVGAGPEPTRETTLGWVPDVLAPLVQRLGEHGAPLLVRAEHINLPTGSPLPDHMRLLARVDAATPPGFDPEAALPG